MYMRHCVVYLCVWMTIFIQSLKSLETPTGNVKEYIVGVYPEMFVSSRAATTYAKKNLVRETLGFSASEAIELSRETIFKTLLDEAEVLRLNQDSKVAFVVENFEVRIPTPVQEEPIQKTVHVNKMPNTTEAELCNGAQTLADPYFWGQQRISQRERVAFDSSSYTYSYSGEDTGSNVLAYVIDTGIALNHTEFGGRAVWGFTAAQHVNESHWDLNGHGTHVAGILGGDNVGVAKNVTLVAVKVLGKTGSGSLFSIISGISFAKGHYLDMINRSSSVRGVINLSLGAFVGIYRPMDRAIQDAADVGLIVVAAAGNDNRDACSNTPSNAPAAISVGSATVNDTRMSSSNYGACVHIMAPGSLINSSYVNAADLSNIYRVISGTSQASPFVAGVVARYLSLYHGDRKTVLQFMQSQATQGVLDLSGTNSEPETPNLLLYAGCNTGYTGILPTTSPALVLTESTTPESATTASTTPALVTTASTTPALVTTASTSPALVTTALTTPVLVTTASSTPALVTTASTTSALVTTASTTPALVTTASTTPEASPMVSTTAAIVPTSTPSNGTFLPTISAIVVISTLFCIIEQ